MDAAALVMLAAEIEPLAELRGWEPVQEQVDLLLAALRGHDGFGFADLDRLRAWTHRWSAVPAHLRAWWARRACADGWMSVALQAYLYGQQVSPSLRAAAAAAWRDDHGVEPWHPLLPGW